jgi:membrane fusion protein, multidrug efflux system
VAGHLRQRAVRIPRDPNVLIVPGQALLFRAQGTQIALIGDGDKVHLQNVAIGKNLGTDVEVVSGLKLSDRLVANPSLGLLEGQQVKIVQPAAGAEPGSNSSAGQTNQPPAGPSASPGSQAATTAGSKPAN